MINNIFRPNRQSIRLREYEYVSSGSYFITICTQDRVQLFGDVIDGQMQLSPMGRMVERAWENIPQYGPRIGLDEFIVMPNHIHGIILIELDGLNPHCGQARRPAPTMSWDIDMVGAGFHPRPQSHSVQWRPSVTDIVQKFKSWTTFQFKEGIKRKGAQPLHRRLWQ